MADGASELLESLREELEEARYGELVAEEALAGDDLTDEERLRALLDALEDGVVTAMRARAAYIRILSNAEAASVAEDDRSVEFAVGGLPVLFDLERAATIESQADELEGYVRELRNALDAPEG